VDPYEPHHAHEHQRPPHHSCTCCSPFSLFCTFWYPWLAARSAFWEAMCCPPTQGTISRLEPPHHHRPKLLSRGG
jgi:hypothetical protein